MRITAGGVELECAPGATVREIVAQARRHGADLPERPWCGGVRVDEAHVVGADPLVAGAALTARRGLDARPSPGRHLAVTAGPDAGAVAPLDATVVIGRDELACIALADPAVSRTHAIVADGAIADVGSANGTRVDGRRVRWRARDLRAGSTIIVGTTRVDVRPRSFEDRPRRHLARTGVGLGAALASGVAIAAMTGRWYLAAIALAGPLAAVRPRRRAPAPLVLDPTGMEPLERPRGSLLAVRGPRGLARAAALAVGPPSNDDEGWEEWMRWLPARAATVTWVRDGVPPSWADAVLEADGDQAVWRADGVVTRGPLPLVSAGTAEAAARRLHARAHARALPADVRWADLPPPSGVSVAVGAGEDGPVLLDLDADGPHALIAGTTGAGKSSALAHIVSSLAWSLAPDELAIALIDFKGGAGLRPLEGLPHVCARLSDLEPHLARRALLGIAAELEQRKRAVAAQGAQSTADLTAPPPRLLIVVDEFQEIGARAPDFLPELARLAAQGRSLGMHLLLSTQRPAGAVSADIRANLGAVLALRTATDADSRDLIGATHAAAIPSDIPGRAILATSRGLEPVQVARPVARPTPRVRLAGAHVPDGERVAAAAARLHAASTPPPPLWLEPLPTLLKPAAPDGRLILGIADHPASRSREVLAWDARGLIAVTGPPRSGRTQVLRALCAQSSAAGLRAVWLPRDPRLALRTLVRAAEEPDALLAADDLDQALARMSELDPGALDVLQRIASRRLAAVVPPAWGGHRLVAQATATVVLAGLTRDDDTAWSVPRGLGGVGAMPGRARVRVGPAWQETHLALAGPWVDEPLVAPLPARVEPRPRVLGVGGDDAGAIHVQAGWRCAVVGPPSDERDAVADAVARACAEAAAAPPAVADDPYALTGISHLILVRPTARSVREACRRAVPGLVDERPCRGRVVLVGPDAALALQVAGV